MLICVSLFTMTLFLPAKDHDLESNVECFGTTCGETICFDFGRILTNEERAWVSDVSEVMLCD